MRASSSRSVTWSFGKFCVQSGTVSCTCRAEFHSSCTHPHEVLLRREDLVLVLCRHTHYLFSIILYGTVRRGTHGEDVPLVPLRVAKVRHDEDGEEDVCRELEHLKVGAAHGVDGVWVGAGGGGGRGREGGIRIGERACSLARSRCAEGAGSASNYPSPPPLTASPSRRFSYVCVPSVQIDIAHTGRSDFFRVQVLQLF